MSRAIHSRNALNQKTRYQKTVSKLTVSFLKMPRVKQIHDSNTLDTIPHICSLLCGQVKKPRMKGKPNGQGKTTAIAWILEKLNPMKPADVLGTLEVLHDN